MVRIGAVIQILTQKGYRYAQYTHKDKEYGDLIRVMKDIYQEPQTDFTNLVSKTAAFSAFIPLQTCINQKLVQQVIICPVPDEAKKFPTFKKPIRNSKEEIIAWSFWDGTNKWKQDELKEEQRDFPYYVTWTYGALETRLNEGWTPRDDM